MGMINMERNTAMDRARGFKINYDGSVTPRIDHALHAHGNSTAERNHCRAQRLLEVTRAVHEAFDLGDRPMVAQWAGGDTYLVNWRYGMGHQFSDTAMVRYQDRGHDPAAFTIFMINEDDDLIMIEVEGEDDHGTGRTTNTEA